MVANFLEYESKNLDIIPISNEEVVVEESSGIPTNIITPFEESFLEDFLYYDGTTFQPHTEQDEGILKFNNNIKEKSLFSPIHKNGGFLAFGGYNLGQLPQRGELGQSSSDYQVENDILYLRKRHKNTGTSEIIDTWVRMDLDNGTFEDIVYNEKKTNENGNPLFHIEQIDDVDTIIFDYAVPWFNAAEGYSVALSSFVSENNGYSGTYINRLTDVSLINQGCLDIPEQIDGQILNELQFEDNKEYIKQIILPTQDLFILGNNNFAITDIYTDLKLLRNDPEDRYNLKGSIKLSLEADTLTDNIFVLSNQSLNNSQIKNLDNILNSYPVIYYGIGCLDNCKIQKFSLRENDIYPNEQINFAIINTPSLQKFEGDKNYIYNINDVDTTLNFKDNNGILAYKNNNEYIVKAISSGFINKIIQSRTEENDKNTIKISEIINKIKGDGSDITITFEDYCLLSPKNQIHTLIFDDTDSNSVDLEENSLNFYKNSKLKKVIVDSDSALTDNRSYKMILNKDATLEINTIYNENKNIGLNMLPFTNLKILYGYKSQSGAFLIISNYYKNIDINNGYIDERPIAPSNTLYFATNIIDTINLSGLFANGPYFTVGTVKAKNTDLSNLSIDFLNYYNQPYNNWSSYGIASESIILKDIQIEDYVSCSTAEVRESNEKLTIRLEKDSNTIFSNLANRLPNLKTIKFNYCVYEEVISFNASKQYYGAYGQTYLPYYKPTELISGMLEKVEYNGINISPTASISNNTFKDLSNLQEIYLTEEMIKQNNIGEGAFFKSKPINIYMYIYKEPEWEINTIFYNNINLEYEIIIENEVKKIIIQYDGHSYIADYPEQPINQITFVYEENELVCNITYNYTEYLSQQYTIAKYRQENWNNKITISVAARITRSGGSYSTSILYVKKDGQSIPYTWSNGNIIVYVDNQKYIWESHFPMQEGEIVRTITLSASDSFDGSIQNVFPNESRVYLYNLGAKDEYYRTQLISEYKTSTDWNLNIDSLEYNTYADLENRGSYLNDNS